MSEAVSLEVGGMTCTGCSDRVRNVLEEITGVHSAEVSHESGMAIIQHDNVSRDSMASSIQSIGYTVDGKGEEFNWRDSSVWKQSAHNTKWCLVGCSIGDFGTIAAFQFVFTDSGWTPMMIMALAMFNGIMTSIALETAILSAQMALKEAFRVAVGMSLISMISMVFYRFQMILRNFIDFNRCSWISLILGHKVREPVGNLRSGLHPL